MSIAEKLTTIAENMQAVYEAGKAAGGGDGGYDQGYADGVASVPNNLKYASVLRFQNVAFPDGYEMTLDLQNVSDISPISRATGIRKVIYNLPLGKAYDGQNSIYNCQSMEELVFPDGINVNPANYFCTGCSALRSITGALDMTGNTSSNMWQGCNALENISFVPGTIGASLTFRNSSLLTDASIQSVIDGLAEVETEQTLTLHAAVGGKLTDAQKATITAKNWTLVY